MQHHRRIAKPVYRISWRWLRGQAATEFALVSLGILTFFFAIMQGASAVSAYNFVTYAARDATRYAMVRGATSPQPAASTDVKNFVLAEAQGINTQAVTVTTTWSPNNNPGSTVKVTVAYAFAPIARIASNITLSLSSTSQMVISQ
jgi:Flp pilus assembly protein TadG